MNCANHPDTAAGAFCRACGKPLCAACQHPSRGSIYCAEHGPASAASASGADSSSYAPPPYTAPPGVSPHGSASPGLAFFLGFIPGVGAIYNGQYAKGFLHVVILGFLISMTQWVDGSAEPLFGLLIAAWFFYMPFEAYHTARKRQLGEPVDEFSGFMAASAGPSRLPAGPLILIAIGVVFLLNTLDIVRLSDILRYWPVVLIALGVYMLFDRISPAGRRF